MAMDFNSWVKKHSLHPNIVAKLKEENMNDIEILKECILDDIKGLDLNSSQQAALIKAFEELQRGQHGQDQFETWALENKLKPDAIAILQQNGLGDCEKLKSTSEMELNALGLRNIQLVLLKKAIIFLKDGEQTGLEQNEISKPSQSQSRQVQSNANRKLSTTHTVELKLTPDNPFDVWLKSNPTIDSKTADKLKERGLDDLSKLEQITEDSLKELKLEKLQQFKLRKAIDALRSNQNKSVTLLHTYADKADSDFVKYLRDNKIEDASIRKLLQNGCDSMESLVQVNDTDVDALRLVPGQCVNLLGIIETRKDEFDQQVKEELKPIQDKPDESLGSQERPDDAKAQSTKNKSDDSFRAYLREWRIHDENIQTLIDKGFDSRALLYNLTRWDIDNMQLDRKQQRILYDLSQQ